jgi:actin-related protein
VLKDSKIRKEDVHDVVLVGGSTRIPKVQLMLQAGDLQASSTQSLRFWLALGIG